MFERMMLTEMEFGWEIERVHKRWFTNKYNLQNKEIEKKNTTKGGKLSSKTFDGWDSIFLFRITFVITLYHTLLPAQQHFF